MQPHARAKAEAGHSCRPGFMPRSAAITGMHTVISPASRLLMPVMHVMERMMAAVRLVDGVVSECSAAAGDEAPGVGCCVGFRSEFGARCEGVSEATVAGLETNSTNSILLSWALVGKYTCREGW